MRFRSWDSVGAGRTLLPFVHLERVGKGLELLIAKSDRLLTLLGPAGVGKTRLSIQLAQEALQRGSHRDGVYWIGLNAIRDTRQIPEVIASEIGLVFAGNDPPETQLGRYLSGKRMLLVLDNFEQLLEGALLAVDLVTSCPDVGILVTSRARLGVHEERVIRVRGLDTPPGDVQAIEAMGYDAVRLFTLRAQQSDPDFRLNEATLPHVLRVCEIVEGAPLGLELAASWVQALPIEDIVDELAQGLDRLPYRAKGIPDRHASLEAALEQSWNLLDERERDVLRRLAVFEGGFRREAASDVAGATLPILASLVDKSLLRLSPCGRYDGDTTSETSDRVRADLPNAQVAWRHHVAVGDADALYVAANFHLQISEQ